MQWYEGVCDNIGDKKIYCRRELTDELKMLKADLSGNSYKWVINKLIYEGVLIRQGYDSYIVASDASKGKYVPNHSDTADELINMISENYPNVKFTLFETALMNEFLRHLIAQNTIFVQAEKESSIYIFRFLQEQGYKNVMYKPSLREFNLYWERDCIVVTDLISEAPLRKDKPHSIMLEKMLVDMLADKLIESTYSKAEYPDVIADARSRYAIDKVRMLRYARRRNRYDAIMEYFEGSKVENAAT